MANKKISELPFIDTISGSSVFDNPTQNTVVPVVMYGNTNQITVENYAKFINLYNAHTGSAGNTFAGPQTINNNVTINGRLTVNEIVAQYETASILFSTGSTKLGDQLTDKHEFTGSTNITGALYYNDVLVTNIDANTIQKLQQATASLNTQTGSQDLVNLQISSTTGSINQTTSSFDSVFLGISSVTGSFRAEIGGIEEYTASLKGQAIVSSSTQITNYHKFAETASANTFYGNQSITGSLSVSAGEFNVITGSGNMTSSLIFDHTQNDGVTLGLRHNDRLSLADHTFNVNVWAAGVYTTFVRNGTPYSILNVEAFDDNKIYLYRDTRLYNKSLVIDNNLTVQKDVVIGTGSLDINNGEFSITSGSGELTSSLSFTHTTVDPITGDATLALRYRNNDVGPENNAWRFVATDNGVQVRYDQYTTSNKLLFSVSSFGSNFDKLLIWRDARLYGTGLTVDDSLLVKGVITGSLLSTNGVVSSSNQLFELNGQTGSQDTINFNISVVTSSIDAHILGISIYTASAITTNNSIDAHILAQSIQTASQDLVNYNISVVTSSIDAHILKQATQTGSQDLVNLGISSVTGSLIGITNGLMAFTAALDSTYATDAQLYQLYQATASIQFTTASLNTQTGSQDLVNLGVSSVTGSLIGITNGLMAFTAALDTTYATDAQLYQLYQATSSIQFATASLNTQTGSQDSVNFNISVVTSSIDAHILVQATQTGSQDLVNLAISTYTGSQDVINISVDSHILGIATQTGSQDLVNLGISTFTGSLRSEVNLIEAYTASLKSALTISGTDVTFAGKITAQEFTTVYTTSSILYQSGSTKFGNSSDDTHEFTGSKFEVFNSDTSGTMYAVVKNNRSRNAAVKTTTTNGSFIAGTSIGTDAFQYQIYDEVEGVNRVTINSQGGTTLQGAVTASQTIKVNGGFVGSQTASTSGYVNETKTITDFTTSYFLNKNSADGEGSSATTFNLTGLPAIDGTIIDVVLIVQKDATVASINTSAIFNINGSDPGISTVFASGTAAVTTIKTFRVGRFNGVWRIVGAIGTY